MRLISYAVLASVLLLNGGCGGSGTSVRSGSTAKLAFAIEWPAPSRFIHQSATHIVVSAKVNDIPIVLEGTPNEDDGDPHTLKILRPDPGQSITSSQVSMTGLPSGPLTFTVESFRTGEAKALGKAVVPVVLVPGNNPNLEFVLESNTTHIVLSTSSGSTVVEPGEQVQLTAVAMQGTAIVLTGGGNFSFTSSNPAICTVDAETGLVTSLSNGAAVITARERGNSAEGKEASMGLNIDAFGDGTVTVHDTGIPAVYVWNQAGYSIQHSGNFTSDGTFVALMGNRLVSQIPGSVNAQAELVSGGFGGSFGDSRFLGTSENGSLVFQGPDRRLWRYENLNWTQVSTLPLADSSFGFALPNGTTYVRSFDASNSAVYSRFDSLGQRTMLGAVADTIIPFETISSVRFKISNPGAFGNGMVEFPVPPGEGVNLPSGWEDGKVNIAGYHPSGRWSGIVKAPFPSPSRWAVVSGNGVNCNVVVETADSNSIPEGLVASDGSFVFVDYETGQGRWNVFNGQSERRTVLHIPSNITPFAARANGEVLARDGDSLVLLK